jgi:hypothetical protein
MTEQGWRERMVGLDGERLVPGRGRQAMDAAGARGAARGQAGDDP